MDPEKNLNPEDEPVATGDPTPDPEPEPTPAPAAPEIDYDKLAEAMAKRQPAPTQPAPQPTPDDPYAGLEEEFYSNPGQAFRKMVTIAQQQTIGALAPHLAPLVAEHQAGKAVGADPVAREIAAGFAQRGYDITDPEVAQTIRDAAEARNARNRTAAPPRAETGVGSGTQHIDASLRGEMDAFERAFGSLPGVDIKAARKKEFGL